jgi:hypothetical protein
MVDVFYQLIRMRYTGISKYTGREAMRESDKNIPAIE